MATDPFHTTSDQADAPFRMMVEQVRDFAIFMVGLDGIHLSWNEGVRRVFGYDADDFIGLTTTALFTPEDIAKDVPRREFAMARRAGEASDDRWMRRRDGTTFWATGITTALHAPNGDVIGYSKVVTDRTEQKRVEEALRTSEERLHAALHAAQMGTWQWDIATDTYAFDESLKALFGLRPDEDVRTLAEFLSHIHPDDRSNVTHSFQRSVDTGTDFNVEFRVMLPDGAAHWVRDQGQVVRDADGHPVSLTGACVDITDRRLTEERVRQAQRMEAVGQLAGGVAHEINNMMQGVLGFSELLFHSLAPSDERRGDVEQIRKAAGRAAMVTGQLLAFSRRQMLQPQVLDLAAVVMGIEPMLRRLLGEDRSLAVTHASGLSRIQADQGQLEQVLINLALNARDAMPGGGRLAIELRNTELDAGYARQHPGVEMRPGAYVVIAVSDTGHGMDADTRARVFEPFFTTKPVGQGTGLGLATVYGIVRQTGGYIWVYSEPDQGTTFRIYLPALREGRRGTPDRLTAPRDEPTVLIVEDEEIVRRWLVRLLTADGFVCLEAGNGIEALRIVDRPAARIDLVLTDVVMPEMGGPVLAERLAAARPDLPVLFMSGYTDDEIMRRGLLTPGSQMVEKPVQAEALLRRVHDLTAGRHREG